MRGGGGGLSRAEDAPYRAEDAYGTSEAVCPLNTPRCQACGALGHVRCARVYRCTDDGGGQVGVFDVVDGLV